MDKEHFPRTQILPDGRQIVIANELCNCTHFRTQHDGYWGSGQCMETSCSCGQFMWKCLVLGGMSDTQDKWIAHIEPTAEGALQEMQKELEEKENEVARLEEDLGKIEKSLRKAEEEAVAHFIKEDRLEQSLTYALNKLKNTEEQLMKFQFPYKVLILPRFRKIVVEDL